MIERVVPMDDPRLIVWLGEILSRAGLVAFPTDTIYGLGGDPWNERAVARARGLKGRGSEQPFTLHLAAPGEVATVAALDSRTREILQRYLPGPYTFLLLASEGAPLSAVREGKVGVRVPDHPFFSGVLCRLGSPLFGTSVNRAGEPPLQRPEEILRAFPELDLVVSALTTGAGTPSAIVDLTVDPPRAVRGELPKGLS